MTFPGRRHHSASLEPARPKPHRPLRGGPIPVTEADLPFYAALVGRAPNADDRTAVLVAEFAASTEQPQGWHRFAARVRQLFALTRAE